MSLRVCALSLRRSQPRFFKAGLFCIEADPCLLKVNPAGQLSSAEAGSAACYEAGPCKFFGGGSVLSLKVNSPDQLSRCEASQPLRGTDPAAGEGGGEPLKGPQDLRASVSRAGCEPLSRSLALSPLSRSFSSLSRSLSLPLLSISLFLLSHTLSPLSLAFSPLSLALSPCSLAPSPLVRSLSYLSRALSRRWERKTATGCSTSCPLSRSLCLSLSL